LTVLSKIHLFSKQIKFFFIWGGGWARVRWQGNSSFANLGRVSACAICKCAVLCVGYSFYGFLFLSLCSKLSGVSIFLHLAVTIVEPNLVSIYYISVYIPPKWCYMYTLLFFSTKRLYKDF